MGLYELLFLQNMKYDAVSEITTPIDMVTWTDISFHLDKFS